MRARSGIAVAGGPLAVVVAIAAATVMLGPSTAWAPVEYVKICSSFGAGFYYIPGTDVCLNTATNDAREATGWRWRIPNNPREWAQAPGKACHGQLVQFGGITGDDLTENDYSRYETKVHPPLQLKPGQYIDSVLYKGGFTGVGRGNFCIYYYYEDPIDTPNYVPLGCIDTAPQATVPATLVF